MEHEIIYLDEVKTRILDPRKEALIEVLVSFIDNSSKSLIKEQVRNLYELNVVKFEFDKPFSFSYVAYSDCSIIPSEFTNTITVNLKIEEAKYGELEEIFEELEFESSDVVKWFNKKTSEYFNEHELCRNMECIWFHESWQIAKMRALNSINVRCFFIEHDYFGGIDADSGIFMSEKEIKKSLAVDGFYIPPVYESKYIIHKNDSMHVWGTQIETFMDFDLAFEYLKTFVNKSDNENASKIYLIRKWLKMPYVSQGEDPWVIDTEFEKKFLNVNS